MLRKRQGKDQQENFRALLFADCADTAKACASKRIRSGSSIPTASRISVRDYDDMLLSLSLEYSVAVHMHGACSM